MSDRHSISPYPLRMPENLRSALEEASQKVGRSLHAEILARLESSLHGAGCDLSEDLLESIGLQANLTLALAAELEGGELSAAQRRSLDALKRVSMRVVERFLD